MVDPVDKYSNSSQLVPVNHIGIINSDTLISYSTQLIGVPTIFVQCHLASGSVLKMSSRGDVRVSTLVTMRLFI